MLAALICTWVVLGAVIVVLLGLTRRVLPTLAAFEGSHPPPLLRGPKPGETLPLIRISDLDGGLVDIGAFANEQILLLFLSSECNVCEDVVRGLESAAVNGEQLPVRTLVVAEEGIARRLSGLPSILALVDEERAALWSVDVPGMPFGIAVDAGGVVRATTHPQGLDDVLRLASHLGETMGTST